MDNDPSVIASRIDPIAAFRAKKNLYTPANAISALRVLLVIPAVLAINHGDGGLAAAIFGLAYFTDLLDGFVARKTNDVSEYGKIIDPLADKIFVGAVVLTMLVMHQLPLWFVVAILSRDLLILLVGIWASRKFQVVLPSNYPGKGAVLCIALTLFMTELGLSQPILVFMQNLSTLLMAVSLVAYGMRLNRLLKVAR
jgi:CDP-diacylglycerol--glycerol-3-phosphate 3-phosphatidyltransferase